MASCISLLGLLQPSTTDWVAYITEINVSSHSSGAQSPKSGCPQEASSWGLWGRIWPLSLSRVCWSSVAFLGFVEAFPESLLHFHRKFYHVCISVSKHPLSQKYKTYLIRAHLHDLTWTWLNLQGRISKWSHILRYRTSIYLLLQIHNYTYNTTNRDIRD